MIVPFGWQLCHGLLVAGLVVDIWIVAIRAMETGLRSPPAAIAVLILIALTQALMVYAIRWILFRLILWRRHPGKLGGAVPLTGVVVIFGMVKLIEYQGFRLWSGSWSLPEYLVFFIPSLVLAVVMSPPELARFQAQGRE